MGRKRVARGFDWSGSGGEGNQRWSGAGVGEGEEGRERGGDGMRVYLTAERHALNE